MPRGGTTGRNTICRAPACWTSSRRSMPPTTRSGAALFSRTGTVTPSSSSSRSWQRRHPGPPHRAVQPALRRENQHRNRTAGHRGSSAPARQRPDPHRRTALRPRTARQSPRRPARTPRRRVRHASHLPARHQAGHHRPHHHRHHPWHHRRHPHRPPHRRRHRRAQAITSRPFKACHQRKHVRRRIRYCYSTQKSSRSWKRARIANPDPPRKPGLAYHGALAHHGKHGCRRRRGTRSARRPSYRA